MTTILPYRRVNGICFSLSFRFSRRNAHADRVSHPQALTVAADGRVPVVQLRECVGRLRLDLRAGVAARHSIVRGAVRSDARLDWRRGVASRLCYPRTGTVGGGGIGVSEPKVPAAASDCWARQLDLVWRCWRRRYTTWIPPVKLVAGDSVRRLDIVAYVAGMDSVELLAFGHDAGRI